MRRAFTTLLLALCFSAASSQSATAQEPLKASAPREGVSAGEAVASLVSLLKNAREVAIPRTYMTERLSSVRAEGCVLRYNVVWENEWPTYRSADRPQSSDSVYRRTDYEWKVNLADLDPAPVIVRSPSGKKESGWIVFRTTGGKESISQSWVMNSRLGARAVTRCQSAASFRLGDDGALEGVAAALKRAVEVCGAQAP